MTVANRFRTPVVGVRTVRLLVSIAIPSPEKKVLESIVLHGVLHAPESQEFLISISCLTVRGLNVKFDRISSVIIRQHGVERIVKRVD